MTNYPAIDTAVPSLSGELSSRVTERFEGIRVTCVPTLLKRLQAGTLNPHRTIRQPTTHHHG